MPRRHRPHVLSVDDGPFDKGVSRSMPLVGVTMEGPDLPEPLRLVHLIARAIVKGESRGRP